MPHPRTLVSLSVMSFVLVLIVSGCSGSADEPESGQPAAAQVDVQKHLSTSGFRVDSTGFQEKVRPYDRIPHDNTCYGKNVSPALSWSEAPEATVSFALLAEDVDHHTGDWVHWVLYNIPRDATGLPTGISTGTAVLLDGTTQGNNDNKSIGYNGPCPPPNITHVQNEASPGIDPPHRYFFRLYALDIELGLAPGATDKKLIEAMQGHILGQANTMGKYTRPLVQERAQEFKLNPTQTAIAGPSPTPGP